MVMNKPKPQIDYIDTQGLSPKLTPEESAKLKREPVEHKPATVRPRRLFTPEMVKELKIVINEVLDEREYKRRMKGAFDEIKHPGPSYLTPNILNIMLVNLNHLMRIGVNHETWYYVLRQR